MAAAGGFWKKGKFVKSGGTAVLEKPSSPSKPTGKVSVSASQPKSVPVEAKSIDSQPQPVPEKAKSIKATEPDVTASWESDYAHKLAAQTGSPLTEQEKAAIPDSPTGTLKSKINRILEANPSITQEEAIGLASYVDTSYPAMNKLLYSKAASESFSPPLLEMLAAYNHGANNALQKLDKATPEKIQKAFPTDYKKGDFLTRFVTIKNKKDLETYLSQYKEGSPVAHPSFTSATVFQAEKLSYFSKGANVELKVLPKGNQTQGVLVDRFKNQAVEGEVLFPAGQKFRVLKVEQDKKYSFPSGDFAKLQNLTEAQLKKVNKALKDLPADADMPPVLKGLKAIKKLSLDTWNNYSGYFEGKLGSPVWQKLEAASGVSLTNGGGKKRLLKTIHRIFLEEV